MVNILRSTAACFAAALLAIPFIQSAPAESPAPSIIPQPTSLEVRTGSFELNARTVIVADSASTETASKLVALLKPATGWHHPISNALVSSNTIELRTAPYLTQLGAEGYSLEVTPEHIYIYGTTSAGLFYGIQTLRQLLPPQIFSTTPVAATWTIPCVKITDQPRFTWRGFMLDSSRHFQTVEEIKRWLDLMAMHKLNVFHWHLVDDHGWRFESKKYPLLTQVAAWREQPPIGRYGGYYTQAEMRDIVAYASSRHITVVPEIEIPGHSRAVLAAYPNLACQGQKTVVDYFFDFPMRAQTFPSVPGSNVYCAGKPGTYQFLEDILTEVLDIFPSSYIHVGGDEVDMSHWNKCPDCQAFMKANQIGGDHQLEASMMKRMEQFLNARGRKLIGWDEILAGGLSPNATVMSWRGTSGGIASAKSGHDAVMSPEKPLYFDHRQSHSPMHPPGFGGSVETLEEVYNYDPVPKELSPEQSRHILGAQANLWSCATPDAERLDLFAFPRMCALAEIAWTPASPKDFTAFQQRLTSHLLRLDTLGINYWRGNDPLPIGTWSPNPALKGGTTFDVPLEQRVAPGPWNILFSYTKGSDALEIEAVELLVDGKSVSSDIHVGRAGLERINNQYAVTVPETKPDAKMSVRVKAHVEQWARGGNGDTAGTISMSKPSAVRLGATLRNVPGLKTTTPVPQSTDPQSPWQQRHQQVLQSNKESKPDVLIISDSLIKVADIDIGSWDQVFGKQSVAYLGLTSADRTQHVLWRIENGELDSISPQQIVLAVGASNVADGDSVKDIVAGIESICLRIHEKHPKAKLLVLGILPSRDAARAAKIDQINFQLQTRLQPQGWVRVYDAGNKLRNADGTFNEALFSDGIHLNAAGLKVLTEQLKSRL